MPEIDERTAVVIARSRPSSACEGERLTRTLDGLLERARVLCHASTAVDERKDTHPRGERISGGHLEPRAPDPMLRYRIKRWERRETRTLPTLPCTPLLVARLSCSGSITPTPLPNPLPTPRPTPPPPPPGFLLGHPRESWRVRFRRGLGVVWLGRPLRCRARTERGRASSHPQGTQA